MEKMRQYFKNKIETITIICNECKDNKANSKDEHERLYWTKEFHQNLAYIIAYKDILEKIEELENKK